MQTSREFLGDENKSRTEQWRIILRSKIIELYLEGKNERDISQILKISTKTTSKWVQILKNYLLSKKENFKQDKYINIESDNKFIKDEISRIREKMKNESEKHVILAKILNDIELKPVKKVRKSTSINQKVQRYLYKAGGDKITGGQQKTFNFYFDEKI